MDAMANIFSGRFRHFLFRLTFPVQNKGYLDQIY